MKTAELFEPWVADCPLLWTSPNAPSKRDILGTLLLSVPAGHWRDAHVISIFHWLRSSAEPLDWGQRRRILLSRVFVHFLGGRLVATPAKLLAESP